MLAARRRARRLSHVGLDLIWPSSCFACGSILGVFQRHGGCADCWAGLRRLARPTCPRCGLPRRSSTDLLGPSHGSCPNCILAPPAVDGVMAVFEYDDLARMFLLRAKLQSRGEILAPLGERLARAVVATGFSQGCSALVPIPSHPVSNLRRGFAPATELARQLAPRIGLKPRPILTRRLTRATAAKRLGLRDRAILARSAFRCRRRIDGERVLLVDDVMTTGTTIDACARALKGAGAIEIRAVVWARALPDRPRRRFDRTSGNW